MLLFHNLREGALPMISDLLFYKLLLVGLFWLCILLHVVWPYDRAASYPPIPQPTLPPRKRSKDPKLFAGLIHKPLCDACEHAVEARPQAPGAPPPLLTFTRGRKRTINTAQQFCPDQDCSYYSGRVPIFPVNSEKRRIPKL